MQLSTPLRKVLAVQMQWASVKAQPVLPMALVAQLTCCEG
jgi:hypothetical protein